MGSALIRSFFTKHVFQPQAGALKPALGKASCPISLAFILAITIAIFSDVLFTPAHPVLSKEGTDLYHQFIAWRSFGFSELRHGNLALWNPHIFSGAPFLGGFQSALLYPPNWLYLILPLAEAINVGIALHVFLLGCFVYLWCGYRGLHPAACIFSSVIAMFSGPYFYHIYAGHLPNLCTMVWAPLLLLTADLLFDGRFYGPVLLGTFAGSMMVLAGHPQYVFYALVTVLLYFFLRAASSAHRLKAAATGLLLAGTGSLLISALQVLTGIYAAGESVRSAGTSRAFAGLFSFPPENLLTLLNPYFFGGYGQAPYWGRWYIWEMCLWMGISGLAIAVYGALRGGKNRMFFSRSMFVILMVLALGAYTPLFDLTCHIPGFGMFRGASKFIFFAMLFASMLAGIGLDGIIREKNVSPSLISTVFSLGAVLCVAAVFIEADVSTAGMPEFSRLTRFIAETGQSYLPPRLYSNRTFIVDSAVFSSRGLLFSSAAFFLLGAILLTARKNRRAVFLVCALAVVELSAFALTARPTFDLESSLPFKMAGIYRQHPGNHRFLNLADANSAMMSGAHDIWGYDPGVLLRYSQLVSFSQGNETNMPGYVNFRRYHPWFSMLRCKYVVQPECMARPNEGKLILRELPEPMPRLNLLYGYRVLATRDDIFREMSRPGFNPRQTVVLERAPEPAPSDQGGKGSCALLDEQTDSFTLEAQLPSPAILLITDSYSRYWKATGIAGAQSRYDVLPANYALMAIPLEAGRHVITMEYSPPLFRAGLFISGLSVLAFMFAFLVWWRRAIKRQE